MRADSKLRFPLTSSIATRATSLTPRPGLPRPNRPENPLRTCYSHNPSVNSCPTAPTTHTYGIAGTEQCFIANKRAIGYDGAFAREESVDPTTAKVGPVADEGAANDRSAAADDGHSGTGATALLKSRC